MTTAHITDDAALDEAFGAERFLLFKHSGICPVSARAFREYEEFLGRRPEVPSGWVDVIAGRPLSRRVEATSGVRHESPQALLFVAGELVWSASHGAITRASLERAWDAHAAGASGV